jgi:5-formyltetrahydrofolate cyclo-ligase
MKSKIIQREHFKRVVGGMSREERQTGSRRIQENLFSIPQWWGGDLYFLFSSLGSEPDTRGIFEELILRRKRVAFPVWHQKELRLSWHLVSAKADLRLRANRIMEPEYSLQTEVMPNEAGLILVPGVAFDRIGFRLGRGAGMYDRTLASMSPHSRKIGLFFSNQEAEQVVVEPHDQKLDYIITPKECFQSKL